MTDNATILSITGRLTYTHEISLSQAAQIVAFLNAEDGEAPALGAPVVDKADTPKAGTRLVESAREALDKSGASKYSEKIVALGAYVLQDGGDTFKAEDVKTQFRRARETPPANFNRDLTTAITAGWIAEDEPGEYYITSKIQGIFDGDFSFSKGANSSRSRATQRSRGASAKKTTKPKVKAGKPEVFAAIDVFPVTMEGFPPYSKMKVNKDRLLWALKFAKSHGIVGLQNKDIEWLTDHLGTGIPNGQITGSFNGAKRPGHANRSTQDGTIRITHDGETYLASIGATSTES